MFYSNSRAWPVAAISDTAALGGPGDVVQAARLGRARLSNWHQRI